MKTNKRLAHKANEITRLLKVSALTTAVGFTWWVSPSHAQIPASSASVSQGAQVAPRAARITRAIDEKQLVRLHGNVHPLAQARFDQGVVNDAQPMDRMLLLLQRAPEDEAALQQLLADQLTLNSPKHHGWLTPQQFAAQFGPVDADIQATTNWLNAKGFHDIKIGAGRTVIEFSGTAGQVRDAFHTEIHHYLVNGVQRFANASDPQIPAALAPVVAGVVSLHNFPKRSDAHTIGKFQRAKDSGVVEPAFSFAGCGTGTGGECNAVGPADLAKIYNIPSGLDGTGQTIAVVGETNINIADVQQYRAIFGLPSNDPTIILNGPDPGITSQGEESEADLDVQLSGGVAPKAAIKFVVSETPDTGSTAGIDLSALYIIDNNIAGVMSESYGACESSLGTVGNAFYNALWEQAAAQGITVLLSTGDSGSAGCDDSSTNDFATGGLAVSGIASTPYNVAVGATDFYYGGTTSSAFWNITNSGTPATESAKSYIPESTWNDSCATTGMNGCTPAIINADNSNDNDLVASGGGRSTIYAKPAWQMGVAGMSADGVRDLPDLSLFGSNGQNNSFYIICQLDFTGANSCDLSAPYMDFEGVGGTSASVQAVAGIMALINQSQATVNDPAPRQGNANYILYKLYKLHPAGICTSNPAAATASGCIYYDVVNGNTSVACQGGSLNCSNTSGAANQYGVLVSGGFPAWTATAGYDFSTGLGTMNVANLAAAWGGVGLTATTTAITASPTGTIAHGSNASFTVHVAAGAGTPTGDVSLIATPIGAAQAGIGPFTLSGGTASISTDMLPGGTAYSVVAHYGGDGTFAQSDSAPITVTVSKESSATAVSVVTFDNNGNIVSNSANTAVYGSPYVLRIDVANAAGTPCSANTDNGTIPPIKTIPCPTGNVTLTDNGVALKDFLNSNTGVSSNVATLNSLGFLEDQPVQLPAGNHSLVAAYAGDNSYTASMSTADAVSITKAPTTVAMTPIPGNVGINQAVTLTATVNTSSSGAGPTGTVTFTSGGTMLGTAPAPVTGTASNLTTGVPAVGTATLSATFLSSGAKSVTATYTGDGNYTGSGPSAAITINVTTSAGSFTVTGTPATVTAGSSGTSTITVTPSGGFTGNVQVMCSGTGLPPGVTCTPLTINVTGATPATGTLTVMVTGPSTTLTASRISEQRSLYAVSRPAQRTNTRGGDGNGWWTLSAGTGLSALLLFFIPGLRGRKQIRAALGLGLICILSFTLGCGGGSSSGGGGGGGLTATHTSITVAVAKLPSTMNNFAFTVAVTGGTPTGQVQLYDGSAALGAPAAVSNGTMSIATGLGAVGTHSVSAHYLGDSTTQASSSGALNLVVTGATTLPLTTTPSGSGNVALTIQ